MNSLFTHRADSKGTDAVSVAGSSGWSAPERVGMWSVGVEATLKLRGLKPGNSYACLMQLRPHLAPPRVPEQRLTISVGGRIAFEGILVGPTTIKFSIAADLISPVGDVATTAWLPDAISPRMLGFSTDDRLLGILLEKIDIVQMGNGTSPVLSLSPGVDVVFMQTADAVVYREMLELTARVNISFCGKYNFKYESFIGIKKGVVPWMATYNRIFMLQEILARGYRGWVAYLDADAYVADFGFNLRRYLSENAQYCLLISTGGGSDTPWDVNAGVFFLNLGDSDGRALLEDWLARFNAMVPDDFLASASAQWDEYPNDQTILYECLKGHEALLKKTKIDRNSLFNYQNGSFIKQAIRAGFPDLHARMNWIRTETKKLLAISAGDTRYVDLTAIANQYGSDKGDAVGNAHFYTNFYQFLFEEFRMHSFDFAEIGLLRGGPEVGIDAERHVEDLPSVRMWLEYFPQAVCHGVDISDFSGFKLERFRFHRCDLSSPEDVARLRAGLPALRFVLDDASHASYHQQAAFAALFPIVESGGYYIIEDLDWQPEAYEPLLPRCRLTRDIFLDFTRTRELDLAVVEIAHRQILGRQIGRVHVQRRRGDGMIKMIALQRR